MADGGYSPARIDVSGGDKGGAPCPVCGGNMQGSHQCPHCGHRKGTETAAAMQAIFKSGNIEQGYASCTLDPMVRAIREGKCDPTRIQCNIPVSISASALLGGTTRAYRIRPVGFAVLRRIELTRAVPDVAAAPNFRPFVQQVSAQGVFTVTTNVEVTPADTAQIATGFLLTTYAANFQNYTAPSGIPFSESNVLDIVIANQVGADTGSFDMTWFYDGERKG